MAEKIFRLVVEVVHVAGNCPVYRVGDRFHIQRGYQLVSDRPVCMHALQAVSPYYIPLSRGMPPCDLGIGGPQGAGYVQCLDPQRYTGGGTVTFRICRDGHK